MQPHPGPADAHTRRPHGDGAGGHVNVKAKQSLHQRARRRR
jgi:hypothetical protein